MKRSAGLWCALALLSEAGCSDDDPCQPDLKGGETFNVEVLSKVDPTLVALPPLFANLPSCNELDAVKVGTRQEVTLDDHPSGGTQCYDYYCPSDFPTPAESSPDRVGKPSNQYVCVSGNTKVALNTACETARFVALYRRTKNGLYGPPDENGTSEVILLRALTFLEQLECSQAPNGFPDTTPGKAYFCADQWNVQLTPAAK